MRQTSKVFFLFISARIFYTSMWKENTSRVDRRMRRLGMLAPYRLADKLERVWKEKGSKIIC